MFDREANRIDCPAIDRLAAVCPLRQAGPGGSPQHDARKAQGGGRPPGEECPRCPPALLVQILSRAWVCRKESVRSVVFSANAGQRADLRTGSDRVGPEVFQPKFPSRPSLGS